MTPDRPPTAIAEIEMYRTIVAEFEAIRLREWLMVAVAAMPYAAGWLAGFLVRMALWTVAAVIVGFKAGRGA